MQYLQCPQVRHVLLIVPNLTRHNKQKHNVHLCFCAENHPIVFLLIAPHRARYYSYTRTPAPYTFRGASLTLCFCLLYQTWLGTTSKNTITIWHGPQVISQVLNTLDGDGQNAPMISLETTYLSLLTWALILEHCLEVLLLKNIFNRYKFLGHGELSYMSILFTPQTWTKKQIIDLNALIPSQKLYFPKHLLTSFVCIQQKIYKKNSFKKMKKT